MSTRRTIPPAPVHTPLLDPELGYISTGWQWWFELAANQFGEVETGKQDQDDDLTAIAALTGTGVAARTAADTWALRTITGTSNEIDLADGDGVSGNPTVGIADDPIIPGSAKIRVPSGLTGSRPGTPVNADFRYNTTDNVFEGYENGAWKRFQEELSGLTITTATVATDDKVLIQDTDDTDNLKTVTAQSIADLAPALSTEQVQDIVGAMVSGNTETLITVTYQDGDGTLDFVVDEASIDHGAIAGLNDDDHTQYLLADGTRALGGNWSIGGNDLTNLGNVTFQTGATGGTVRTGTTGADKFVVQVYDTNAGAYVDVMQADAGNPPVMQIIVDYFQFEDATAPTKIAKFDSSSLSVGTHTFVFPDGGGTFYVTAGTDVAVADGGTGASTASGARTNLGVAIGSDVQAWDADLDTIAALSSVDGNFIVGSAGGWVAESGATARTSLGVAIGSDVQAWDTDLDAIAALSSADGNIIVGSAGGWVAESGATARTSLGLGTGDTPQFTGIEVGAAADTTLTRASAGDLNVEGNIVYRAGGTDVPVTDGGTGASTAGTARTNLGVAIGSDVQAWDAQLDDIAALAVTDGNFIVGDGANWVAESGSTARASLTVLSIAQVAARASLRV